MSDFIPKPKQKDFKSKKEFEAAMAEFKKAMQEKRNGKKSFSLNELTSPMAKFEQDPNWHGADTEYGKAIGNLSFNFPVGLSQPVEPLGATDFAWSNTSDNIAQYAVASVRYKTVIPRSTKDGTLNMRLCAQELYTWMRSHNAGSTNYDPADLFMYCLAYGEALAFHAWMVRLYGTLKLYDKLNRNMPNTLLEAMGISNSAAFMDGAYQAQLLEYINIYARRLAKFSCPPMPYFARRIVLNSFIYQDNKTGGKGQIIIYTPEFFGEWCGTRSTGSSVKLWSAGATNIASISVIQNLGNNIINTMLDDQDVGIISGDLLKAFGDGVVKIREITPEYTTPILHDVEMLDLFENAVICPVTFTAPTGYDAGEVYQLSDGSIRQPLSYTGSSVPVASAPKMLNYVEGEANVGRNLTSTRMMFGGEEKWTSSAKYYGTIDTCGTELVSSVLVYMRPNQGPASLVDNEYVILQNNSNTSLTKAIAEFDYYPHKLVVTLNATTGAANITNIIGHYNNFRALSQVELDGLNYASGATLFAVKHADAPTTR